MERLNSNTWSIIKNYYIPCDILINKLRSNSIHSKILLKLVSMKHDTECKNEDINYIK